MIISAHLGDCLLIASDKRAMICDIETGDMHLFHDEEQKIKLWPFGAIAGTGDKVFLNRVFDYFCSFKKENQQLNEMDQIHKEIKIRLLEGVPKDILVNNSFIFSMFNGETSSLYSIPLKPFFSTFDRGDGVEVIRPQLHNILPWAIEVTCFHLPSDMTTLQNFQRNLRPLSSFISERSFIEYYIQHLKQIFAIQASIDPSITTSFDLYLQICKTGHSFSLHIENRTLAQPFTRKR